MSTTETWWLARYLCLFMLLIVFLPLFDFHLNQDSYIADSGVLLAEKCSLEG